MLLRVLAAADKYSIHRKKYIIYIYIYMTSFCSISSHSSRAPFSERRSSCLARKVPWATSAFCSGQALPPISLLGTKCAKGLISMGFRVTGF